MTKSNLKIVREEIVNVGFDVSADTLNWTVVLPGDLQIDGECLNTTDGITDTLNSLHTRTTQAGSSGRRVPEQREPQVRH